MNNKIGLVTAGMALTWLVAVEVRAASVTLSPTGDSCLTAVAPTQVNGTGDALNLYHRAGNNQNGILQFDLNSLLEAGRWRPTINAAQLVVYRDSAIYTAGDGGTYTYVYRVTKQWAETEATWNSRLAGIGWSTAGGDYVGTTGIRDASPYASNTLNIADGTAGVFGLTNDVAALVQEWVSGAQANLGLILVGQEGNGLHCHSREAANPDYRPVLIVDYTPGPPVLTPAADAAVLQVNPTSMYGADDYFSVYHRTNENNVQNTFLQFNLDSLNEAGRWYPTIHAATLVMWRDSAVYDTGDNGAYTCVYRVVSPWAEGQVTWNSRLTGTAWTIAGGDYVGTTGVRDESPYASNRLNIADGTAGIYALSNDVTALVAAWVSGAQPNYGLALVGQQADGLLGHTREATNEFLRPMLLVDYTRGPKVETATLTPTADDTVMDLYGGNRTLNQGTSDILTGYNDGLGNVQQSFLQFDFGSICGGGHPIVHSAKLVLWRDDAVYGTGDNGKYTGIYRVTNPWDEAQATWNSRLAGTPWTTAGGDYVGTTGVRDESPYASNTLNIVNWVPGVFGFTNDVTALVTEWTSGTQPNHGLATVIQAGANGLFFHSREAVNSLLRPTLTVIYEPPVMGTALMIQ